MRSISMAAAAIRQCPVCGSQGSRHCMHNMQFCDGMLGDGYDVVTCSTCGAGFADRVPTQSALDHYYSEESKYGYESNEGRESEFDFRRFEMTCAQIEPHLVLPNARILDIGCATGGLLSVFKRKGFANLLGVDPSPMCATAASRLYGIEVRTATLSGLEALSGRFDLVTLVGVVEHLADPVEAAVVAAKLLDKGGLLYVSVPDVAGLAGSANAPYQQFSMEHLNFFSERSLDALMARAGFAPLNRWQKTVEWREGVTEPVLSTIYEIGHAPVVPFDDITGPALERYVETSRLGEQAIEARVLALVEAGEAILVWGAGALTRRLLATTALSRARISGFIDSNPHLWHKKLSGIEIFPPSKVAGRREPIVICSVAFEQEIRRAIREKYSLNNAVFGIFGS